MKKIILAVFVAAFSLSGAVAQTKVKQDSKGNFVQVSSSAARVPAVGTGRTFTDSKGVVYPVLKSGKGKLFYLRTSKKSGKEYKVYLTAN